MELTSNNTIAEIRGTTDEVVMLGGHLDSWHAATGATDNAIGCAVAMEAVRILQGVDGIAHVELDEEDVVRHRLVKAILRAYNKEQEQEQQQDLANRPVLHKKDK